VNPLGYVLGGDESLEKRDELLSLPVREPFAELGFVFGGHLHDLVQELPTLGCEVQRASAPVGRIGASLQQPALLEFVDQRDHATGRNPKGLAECLLGSSLGGRDVAQEENLTRIDAESGQSLLPQQGRVRAQLGQQKGGTGHAQACRQVTVSACIRHERTLALDYR
jgi:hypothetical protein